MVELYIADIRCLAQEAIFWEKIKMLPEERWEKIIRYKQKEDQMRGLGAGLLLEYGLRCHGLTLLNAVQGLEKAEIFYGTHGKPYLSHRGNLYFNISHSGDYAAVAFSQTEVGVDIERIRKIRPGVMSRYFHLSEREYLEKPAVKNTGKAEMEEMQEGLENALTETDMKFTELWTRKESYIKAVGKGLSLPLTSFSTLENPVGKDDRYCLYSFCEPEGYFISVCGRMEEKPALRYVNLR